MAKRRIGIVLILTVTMVLIVVGTVAAITDGEFDNGAHPYVGLMVAKDAAGNPLWACSGTLLSPTIFLTAGHCTEEPATQATIWFEDDVDGGMPGNGYPFGSPTHSYTGTAYTHPEYYSAPWFMHDLGVVELDAPIPDTVTTVFGELPEEGILNQMGRRRGRQDVTFTAVGYGMQASSPVPSHNQADRVRMFSRPRLIQINAPGFTGDYSILLSNNQNTGGTCFGDSGGPDFIGESNVVAGVTSYGMNGNCAGTGGVYRVDTADDLDWLATFGVYPPE